MPRPTTRTAQLAESERKQLRHHFGTVTHAFELLGPYLEGLTWGVFRLAAAGHAARPDVVERIRGALTRWKTANLKNPT